VKPPGFAYARARSLDHAIELLGSVDGEARVLAGGQSLIATLNMRLGRPDLLVDVNGLSGLDRITVHDDHIEIGALVRQAAAERSEDIRRHAPLVALALPHIAHPAIRNRGTIGGSVAFADPAAELPACLLAIGGEIEIAGPGGRRTVAADDFFRDLYETALGPGEVLTAIRLPGAGEKSRYAFAELARRRGDYALAGLAASARADGAGLADVRLAFFGVGLKPLRARRAEAALAGASVDAAIAVLDEDLDPPDDVQARAATKRHLAGILLRRVAGHLHEARP
jgi:carbon-monoxide dehydrogenase medium subunit